MNKDKVLNMVDRIILNHFRDGGNVIDIESNLELRCQNFLKVLLKDDTINIDSVMSLPYDEIKIPRTKYGVFYIKSCKKRIKDLGWLKKNKNKFSNKSDEQIFKLIKLKDILINQRN